MIYAMFPDIPDVDELTSGQRREGTYSALVTFTRKLSSAIALFLISNGLALAGYRAPLEEVVNGVEKLVEQPQSDSFLLALRLIFFFVPVVLVGAALMVARRYPLDPHTHARLNRVLAARRSGQGEGEALRVEAEDLARTLVGTTREEPR
jgi:Na+/melibiose symporter-like transporter